MSCYTRPPFDNYTLDDDFLVDYIYKFKKKNHYMPTFRDLMRLGIDRYSLWRQIRKLQALNKIFLYGEKDGENVRINV